MSFIPTCLMSTIFFFHFPICFIFQIESCFLNVYLLNISLGFHYILLLCREMIPKKFCLGAKRTLRKGIRKKERKKGDKSFVYVVCVYLCIHILACVIWISSNTPYFLICFCKCIYIWRFFESPLDV